MSGSSVAAAAWSQSQVISAQVLVKCVVSAHRPDSGARRADRLCTLNRGSDCRDCSAKRAIEHGASLGIALGGFLGKQIGVTGATWAAVRLGLGAPAKGTGWRQFHGIIGIGASTALSAAAGYLILR